MQALHAAAQGLHAPQALHAAIPGVAVPIAAATASGSTVVASRRLRVDFTFFMISSPNIRKVIKTEPISTLSAPTAKSLYITIALIALAAGRIHANIVAP
ncbi:MAG: hypothetical protein VCC99_13430 [Alphaproteobacteria bacterium]